MLRFVLSAVVLAGVLAMAQPVFADPPAATASDVDGGQNPRINGDGQKVGTRFAITSSMQKGWTVGPLSTP